MLRLNKRFEEELKLNYGISWYDFNEGYFRPDDDGGFLYINSSEMVGIILEYFYKVKKATISVFYGECKESLWEVFYPNPKCPKFKGHSEGDTFLCALTNMIEDIYHDN